MQLNPVCVFLASTAAIQFHRRYLGILYQLHISIGSSGGAQIQGGKLITFLKSEVHFKYFHFYILIYVLTKEKILEYVTALTLFHSFLFQIHLGVD